MDRKVALLAFFILSIVQGYDYCQAPDLSDSVETDGLHLRQVQVVFRHGDRTPIALLPDDIQLWNCSLSFLINPTGTSSGDEEMPPRLHRKVYLPGREELPGNCAIGQLTDVGRKQHLKLGSQFRKLYIDKYDLLPSDFPQDRLWTRSTDIPRTMQSLMANLEGMFPPKFQHDGKVELIPIHTMDTKKENMFPNNVLCPRLTQLDRELRNSTAWRKHEADLVPLRTKLSEIFKVPLNKLPSIGGLLDPLSARVCHNLPLPAGLTTQVLQQMVDANHWEMNFQWKNPQVGQMGMSPFLRELFTRMEKRVGGEKDPKFFAYSGHDTTVGPLAAFIGAFDDVWPPYVSHVEFELWQDTQAQWFVQVKYNGKSVKMGNCSGFMCPWSTFRDHMTNLLPTDYDALCGL